MLSSQLVVLLLVTSLTRSTSLSQTGSSGDVLQNITLADVLSDYLHPFWTRNNFMDVFVNPECLKENTAQFKCFLESRTEPVTLWTDGKMQVITYDEDTRRQFRHMFIHSVHIVCGHFVYYEQWLSTQGEYFTTAFVIMENALVKAKVYRKLPFLPPYPRASGRYVLTVANYTVSLNSEFERNLIVHRNLSTDLWLDNPRPLSSTCVRLACFSQYQCEHPSFGFVADLLTHRNASLCPDRFIKDWYHLSSYLRNIDTGARRVEYSGHIFHQYGSAGFSFYVPKRDRVPRETIFVLPFSGEVWIALLASSLVLVLTYVIISMLMQKPKVDPFVFILPMIAASLQQSTKLHSSLLITQPTRVLYGVMALMFVVVSTVFKGRLISLLNDLPLQGKVTEFESFQDIVRKGHRLCILEEEHLIPLHKFHNYPPGGPIKHSFECLQKPNPALGNSRRIRIDADGRDTFFTYNSPTGPSGALRRELLGRGYIQTRETVFSYAVGPEMRASSIYRHELGVTLARAIQAGLYVRRAQLVEYKSRPVNDDDGIDGAKKLVLDLTDLRPFFLAWFVGVSLSILALGVEVLLARLGCRSYAERLVVIVRPPLRKRRRRRACVLKHVSRSRSTHEQNETCFQGQTVELHE